MTARRAAGERPHRRAHRGRRRAGHRRSDPPCRHRPASGLRLARLGTAALRRGPPDCWRGWPPRPPAPWKPSGWPIRPPRARELAEVDRVRSALLAAVGHDLRTPLAGIKAAVSSLRQPDLVLSPCRAAAELLATIEESTDRLDALVDNLLSMSRLQAGVLSVAPPAGGAGRGGRPRRCCTPDAATGRRGRHSRRPAARPRRPRAARTGRRQPGRQRPSRQPAGPAGPAVRATPTADTGASCTVVDHGARGAGRRPGPDLRAVPAPRRPHHRRRSRASASPSPAGSPRRWAARSPARHTGRGLTMTVTCPAADTTAAAGAGGHPVRPRPARAGVARPMSRHVLVVDDDRQLLRALRITCAPAATRSAPPPTAPRRSRPPAATRPTWSSSTSACPTSTASRSSRRCGAGPPRRSSCCPPATPKRQRSPRWTPAPTTTSPNRSAWTNCWPGCAPPCAAPPPAATEPSSAPTRSPSTSPPSVSRPRRRRRPAHPHRVAPARGARPRNAGKLVTQRQLLQEVWGPAYATETNYLRVLPGQPAPQARTRPRPAPLPDHRTGHRLPPRHPLRLDLDSRP